MKALVLFYYVISGEIYARYILVYAAMFTCQCLLYRLFL